MIARLCRAFFMHCDSTKAPVHYVSYQMIARLCRAFFMHMFGEKGISLNFKWQLTSTSTVIARFCRAFFMHKGDSLWSITTKVKSDCPVLSGFFHARQYLADNYPECEICVCDCPVLSGFFHARSWRDKICSGSMIARLCRAFFIHF